MRKVRHRTVHAFPQKSCGLCGKYFDEYMIIDEVWNSAGLISSDIICEPCVEKLIGRKLTPTDYIKTAKAIKEWEVKFLKNLGILKWPKTK